MKEGRIPCVNPRCRRTDSVDKFPGCKTIICAKCFRALPQPLRTERRRLDRAERRMRRRIERRVAQGTIEQRVVDRIWLTVNRRFRANWQNICTYFAKPERPIGIEGFLKDIGLA